MNVSLLVLVICVVSAFGDSLEVSAGLDGLAVGAHRVLAGIRCALGEGRTARVGWAVAVLHHLFDSREEMVLAVDSGQEIHEVMTNVDDVNE